MFSAQMNVIPIDIDLSLNEDTIVYNGLISESVIKTHNVPVRSFLCESQQSCLETS